MRRIGLALALSFGALAGCSKPPPPEAAPPSVEAKIAELTVDQVDQLIADHACVPVDANGDPLRRKMGTLPGAVLLTDFDKLDNLPRDKATQLVFYCANTMCSASHLAADQARAAGYARVAVMPAGIAGWVKAGKQTSSI